MVWETKAIVLRNKLYTYTPAKPYGSERCSVESEDKIHRPLRSRCRKRIRLFSSTLLLPGLKLFHTIDEHTSDTLEFIRQP